MLADGLKVRAARDKCDILPSLRQFRAEISADGPRTENRKSHPQMLPRNTWKR
jgi:hypothetical protein